MQSLQLSWSAYFLHVLGPLVKFVRASLLINTKHGVSFFTYAGFYAFAAFVLLLSSPLLPCLAISTFNRCCQSVSTGVARVCNTNFDM